MLGGYTTFSTLSNDSWLLMLADRPIAALFNTVGSSLAGLGCAAMGWHWARS
jgi:fluoride ion exporter CrcB/FEX